MQNWLNNLRVLVDFGAFLFIIVYHCWREHRHDQERKELYSRLMARSLAEYSALSTNQEREPPKPRCFIKLPPDKAGEE